MQASLLFGGGEEWLHPVRQSSDIGYHRNLAILRLRVSE
jgi:hypothetical protein